MPLPDELPHGKANEPILDTPDPSSGLITEFLNYVTSVEVTEAVSAGSRTARGASNPTR